MNNYKIPLLCFAGGFFVQKVLCLCFRKLTNPKKSNLANTNTLYLVDPVARSIISEFISPQENNYTKLITQLDSMKADQPIDIIVSTHGGPVIYALQIADFIKNHKGKVRTFVKSYAHSAGTIIALAADEIYFSQSSTLSAIDPQINIPNFLSNIGMKDIANILGKDPREQIREKMDRNFEHYRSKFLEIINDKYQKDTILKVMYDDPIDHSMLFFKSDLAKLDVIVGCWDGINVSSGKLEV